MKCVKACPYDRFRKEVRGTKELDIGGKKFTIPLTNKWRCFLCYFEINPRFIPKEITEEVAIRITNHNLSRLPKWIADNAACLATCLPPSLRQKNDTLYPNSIARKREMKDINPAEAALTIKEKAQKAGLDLYIGSKEEFLQKGINLEDYLPGASTAVLFGASYSDGFLEMAVKERAKNLLFDLSHYLQGFGCYTLPASRLDENIMRDVFAIPKNESFAFGHLLTAMPLQPVENVITYSEEKKNLSSAEIKSFILAQGADLAGITSAERLDKLLASAALLLAGEQTIIMDDMPADMADWGTQKDKGFNVKAVGIEKKKMKSLNDYLPGAASVIVLGIHYPYALMERAGKPPAENIGPFYNLNRVMPVELSSAAYDMIRFLRERGYKAVAVLDLEGIAWQREHISSRFPAIAAGLGELGWCGKVLTPEYGFAQRFAAIITNAGLEQDALYRGPKLCRDCMKCADECPVQAISKTEKITVKIEDQVFEFGKVDSLKCEWAKRFGFVGKEGPEYMGSRVDFPPPAQITAQTINETLNKIRKMDDIERKCWNISIERCMCPVRGLESGKSNN
ncbi:MAG: hypothetical protein A2096_04015 [Spirochaetes bacterium GWF1_41_5]|nr:MAG: hypothetical protein A2096_04015 [Spirochaetes bacterium GWF1_41_5]